MLLKWHSFFNIFNLKNLWYKLKINLFTFHHRGDCPKYFRARKFSGHALGGYIEIRCNKL